MIKCSDLEVGRVYLAYASRPQSVVEVKSEQKLEAEIMENGTYWLTHRPIRSQLSFKRIVFIC